MHVQSAPPHSAPTHHRYEDGEKEHLTLQELEACLVDKPGMQRRKDKLLAAVTASMHDENGAGPEPQPKHHKRAAEVLGESTQQHSGSDTGQERRSRCVLAACEATPLCLLLVAVHFGSGQRAPMHCITCYASCKQAGGAAANNNTSVCGALPRALGAAGGRARGAWMISLNTKTLGMQSEVPARAAAAAARLQPPSAPASASGSPSPGGLLLRRRQPTSLLRARCVLALRRSL